MSTTAAVALEQPVARIHSLSDAGGATSRSHLRLVVRGETDGDSKRLSLDARFEAEALPQMRALYGSAYRLTGNAADAEDLVQETMMRAYKGFAAYEPGTNVRAWLYTILYRVRTDNLRRAGRSPKTVTLEHDVTSVAPAQDGLASGHEEIARALARLPECFKVAVVLRDVQDLSYEEIAAALRVPIGTVMSRIHRGRALLRKELAGLRRA